MAIAAMPAGCVILSDSDETMNQRRISIQMTAPAIPQAGSSAFPFRETTSPESQRSGLAGRSDWSSRVPAKRRTEKGRTPNQSSQFAPRMRTASSGEAGLTKQTLSEPGGSRLTTSALLRRPLLKKSRKR